MHMKRILSLILAFVLVLGMFPATAFATEGGEVPSVDVVLSLSADDQFMVGPESGAVMALKDVTVPYFDLALYGLEEYYFVSESYGDDGDGAPGSDLQPGTAEYAYGKVTLLHLYIYALEVFYCGIDPEEAGKGYLYEQGLIGTEVFSISGSVGSSFLNQFWGGDCNLNYYVNYEYPLASSGWGATSDQILLKDGDIVTLGHFTGWSFYADPASIFNYMVADNDTPTQGDEITLTLYRAGADWSGSYGTAHTVIGSCPDVYYTEADSIPSENVTEWTYLGTAAEDGTLVVDTADLEPGEYIIAMAGQPGEYYPDEICSTPGGIRITVEAAEEAPAQTTTVYFSVTKHANIVESAQGDPMALVEMEVPYFDIGLYGLEAIYYNPDCYGAQAGASSQVGGTAETAEGVVTILHVLIWATEVYWNGLDEADAGKGWLANEGGWNGFSIGADPGSAFCTFWNFGSNLNYYLNYEYPLAYPGWGSTCDQIPVADGDVVSVRYNAYTGNDGVYHHFNKPYLISKDVLQGNQVSLTVFACTEDYTGYTTGHEPVGEGVKVYVVSEIGGEVLAEAATNAYGDVRLDVSRLAVGSYYVLSDNFDPAIAILNITPNVHTHNYNETVTAPTCTEGGYTTYTCACGDSYVGAYTEALGHDFQDGMCTRCDAVHTEIPEGAPFLNIVTDKEKPVVITKMDGFYKVEVPVDTEIVYITYPDGALYVDSFNYVKTHMVGFEGVSEDGYGKKVEDGEITVGLNMVKAPANGAPHLIKLANVPFTSDPRRVGLCKADGTENDYFAFTYILNEGEHFAVLPEGIGYTVTGQSVASNGYTFNVSIANEYEATAEFAVKVNGETVATQPGDITIESVTEDLYITVEGVAKIVTNTDISYTLDLTDCPSGIQGSMEYMNTSYEGDSLTVECGKKNSLSLPANKNMMISIYLHTVSPLVVAWDINGVIYEQASSYFKQSIGNGNTLYMDKGYFKLDNKGTEPCVMVVKPIVAELTSIGAAPAFNEDCIRVDDISLLGVDVESFNWDGDTLNVVLSEDTAMDATVNSLWTVYVKNTQADATDARFYFNGSTLKAGAAEGTAEGSASATLVDGVGSCEVAFTTKEHAKYVQFTPKTFTVNFTVKGVAAPHIHSYVEEVVEPTCTEGGYTTYTCSCGDQYKGNYTSALGHDVLEGICSRCGLAQTVIPEGAPFLSMVTDKGEIVTVTDMGMEPNYSMGTLYKVEVPVGTTRVDVTYNEADVYVDGFGYATTYMLGFSNSFQDGYPQATKEGKTTVGLSMEKAPANGSPETLKLLNVPYPDDPYILKAVYLMNDDMSVYHAFAFTYKLEEGQFFAALPEGIGYAVTGEPIASNGYTFNVAIAEGYEATADFAILVNGTVVSTVPGDVTVETVTENLTITVEGVAKIVNPETDIALTIDLSDYEGPVDGSIWYSDKDYNNVDVGLTAGKKTTLALTAADNQCIFANIYGISALTLGYEINGTFYALPSEYTGYDLGNGFYANMDGSGYLSLGTNGTEPGVFVIKPVVATPTDLGAAPAFAENDVIRVENIAFAGAEVDSFAWEGDTLNVILAEGTAPDAALKTIWTIYVHNKKEGAGQPLFSINGQLQCPMSAEATFDWTNGITLVDGSATMTVAFEVADVYWDPASQLEFTNKTFTLNFSIKPPHEHSYEAVVTAPTCTEGGYTTYTCACGDSYVADETAALGHAYEGVVTAPTCTEKGCTTYTCSRCSDSYVADETPALGHDWKGTGCTRCDAVRENPFTDVPEDSFYIDPVLWAVEEGITNGASETEFDPNGDLQRAQVVVMLWRAAGKPAPTTTVNPFTDVNASDWYYDAVLWAVEKGITNGTTATTFDPYGKTNRAQAITFLWRYLGQPEGSAQVTFSDVEAGAWYADAIEWAVWANVTNGMDDGSFGITVNCNRAHMVTFLYRALA